MIHLFHINNHKDKESVQNGLQTSYHRRANMEIERRMVTRKNKVDNYLEER